LRFHIRRIHHASSIDACGRVAYNASVTSLLHAGWLLAWSLVRTLLRRILLPNRDGLVEFTRHYANDRLMPLTISERDLIPRLSACIGCGRCDWYQTQHTVASRSAYRGMMAFVLSASRSMPDFDVAADAMANLSEEQLSTLRQRCPVDIPFSELAGFVRSKAQLMLSP